jgi:hypothetical protein
VVLPPSGGGVRRKPQRGRRVGRACASSWSPTRHVPEGGGNPMTLGATLPRRPRATSAVQPAYAGNAWNELKLS